MSTTAEKIAVMQAFEDGKEIQYKEQYSTAWLGAATPNWDWRYLEYRIKPEPREPRVIYVGFTVDGTEPLEIYKEHYADLIKFREVIEDE